jgi:F-type H+-transporting ATPase subunit b
MNLLMSIFVAAEGEPHRDDAGQIITHHWLWPEQAELIYGTISSIVIFALLYKFAGPAIKKGFTGRTERIHGELTAAADALAAAKAEAEQIRQAKGDIDAERQRLFAEADANAEARLADGRMRLEEEVAELEARAVTELATAAGRSGDELRAEIASVAAAASELLVSDMVDEATHQALIEGFIQRVGASS